MWSYDVIDCQVENLKNQMGQWLPQYEVKPMGLATYERNGRIRCILAYGRRKKKNKS